MKLGETTANGSAVSLASAWKKGGTAGVTLSKGHKIFITSIAHCMYTVCGFLYPHKSLKNNKLWFIRVLPMKLPGTQQRLEEVTVRSQEIVQAHNTSRLYTF